MSRPQQRFASLLGMFAAAGAFVYFGYPGWTINFLPAHYLGYLIGAFGIAGLCGFNIWRGGPLDKQRDEEGATADFQPVAMIPLAANELLPMSAVIQPIDDVYAKRILTTKTIIIGNLFCFAPLLAIFAGLGLAAGAAWMAFDDDFNQGAQPALNPMIAWPVIGVGLAIAGVSAYWGLRNVTKMGNWYLRGLARREISSRPGGIVDPNDSDAILVEIVPRQNWGRMMLETATDLGYLLIDDSRRDVLFEGDRQRMRIPAKAIFGCRVEQMLIGQGTEGAMPHCFTVLSVQHNGSKLELPMAYRGDMGMLGGNVRLKRADELCQRIWALKR